MGDLPDPGRWRRIAPLLDELLELPEADRPARLAKLCGDDDALRSELEDLLALEGRPGLLDSPADEYLATLIQEARASSRGDSDSGTPAGRTGSTDATGAESFDARFLPGTLLAGRYRIINRLGRGGMGEVFRAEDLKLGQTVALKFLSSELAGSEELRARFLTEIRLARQLAHPNVCRVYDVGDAEGVLFLSMEYIEGEDLSSLLKRIGRLPREKAAQIAQQLCAGLAAAHAEGILHRDLKPANVMLDERGRVRITDFGLAGLAEDFEGAEILAGTPAYMSPEQLAGTGVTAQSDIYALGLVLYEIFTGRRAFEGGSFAEVRRARETTPARPSTHVSTLDPAVERVLLECLEPDPAERPSSAREVAAALPGGDPLAAALAAGETPSPELVAASGPRGSLAPRMAMTLLAATLAALAVVTVLAPAASLIGRVPFDKPAAALASDAREILVELGYTDAPRDRAWSFRSNRDYLRHVRRTDASPERWQALALPDQMAFRFHYRQAPQPLFPENLDGQVWDEDPPPEPGDARLVTDLGGRLRSLSVVPPAAAAPGTESPPQDWSGLFDAAGLDLADFESVPPTRQPRVFTEHRAAWTGSLPDAGDLPVRIEAAASGGRPVFFEAVLPSDPYWSVEPQAEQRPAGGSRVASLVWIVIIGSALVVAAVFAVRNLRSGRGDREGAARLARIVLVARVGWWVLAGHHIPSFWPELWLLAIAAGRGVFVAAVAWCLYIAVEPLVRRLWPQFLIAWSRLLAGRWRDPLVGRDLLIGVLSGAVFVVFGSQLHVLIPEWLGWPNPPPPMPYPGPQFFSPPADPLLGTRNALAAVGSAVLTSVWGTLTLLAFLLGVLTVVRRRWIAFAIFVAFTAAFGWAAEYSDYSWLALTLSALAFSTTAFVMFRFGFLAGVVGCFTLFFYNLSPLTADPSSPYFPTSLFAFGLLAALAAYGCRISVGPHRARVETPAAVLP